MNVCVSSVLAHRTPETLETPSVRSPVAQTFSAPKCVYLYLHSGIGSGAT